MTQPLLQRDNIVSFVKSNGPVLPYQIAKLINENMIIASAYLSELAANGILKISSLKVGGSPLYYVAGQEHLLQKYSSNLHEKEKKAYDLLQQKNILEDTSLDPVTRVALREIKDFAVPVKVNQDNKVYLFWKWYLTKNEEVQRGISDYFALNFANIRKQESITEQQPTLQKPISQITIKKEEKIEPTINPKTDLEQQIMEQKESIKKLTEIAKDSLYNNIIEFFKKNKINILSYEIIKKNSEIDFIVEIPSPLGNLAYYCKTKNKKRISDSDLKSAYVNGQLKKLPVVFLSSGELSKKAEEVLKELKGLNFVKF